MLLNSEQIAEATVDVLNAFCRYELKKLLRCAKHGGPFRCNSAKNAGTHS